MGCHNQWTNYILNKIVPSCAKWPSSHDSLFVGMCTHYPHQQWLKDLTRDEFPLVIIEIWFIFPSSVWTQCSIDLVNIMMLSSCLMPLTSTPVRVSYSECCTRKVALGHGILPAYDSCLIIEPSATVKISWARPLGKNYRSTHIKTHKLLQICK